MIYLYLYIYGKNVLPIWIIHPWGSWGSTKNHCKQLIGGITARITFDLRLFLLLLLLLQYIYTYIEKQIFLPFFACSCGALAPTPRLGLGLDLSLDPSESSQEASPLVSFFQNVQLQSAQRTTKSAFKPSLLLPQCSSFFRSFFTTTTTKQTFYWAPLELLIHKFTIIDGGIANSKGVRFQG